MKQMGTIRAEIELINADDLALERKHHLDKDEVKRIRVKMLVDSGAWMMCINETIQDVLQLPFVEKRKTFLANGVAQEFDVVGPIIVKFENRTATCNAFVLPGDAEPLLGAIPMEEMDVLIHPSRQELIVNPKHPDGAVLRI
jgi:clan AA aspartic protease